MKLESPILNVLPNQAVHLYLRDGSVLAALPSLELGRMSHTEQMCSGGWSKPSSISPHLSLPAKLSSRGFQTHRAPGTPTDHVQMEDHHRVPKPPVVLVSRTGVSCRVTQWKSNTSCCGCCQPRSISYCLKCQLLDRVTAELGPCCPARPTRR